MKQDLFDLQEGLRRKDEGLRKVEDRGGDWLKVARNEAVRIIRDKGYCTSDDIHERCEIPPWLHRNTMGAVFKDKRFTFSGFTISRRPEARGRTIRRYKLR